MTHATPTTPHRVTRIARRRAKPGHEAAYEVLLREMIQRMREVPGFSHAELVSPDAPGGEYQTVAHFDSEAALTAWDTSRARAELHVRMREVAEAQPEYRVLTGLEAWFAPAVVPASTQPPRARMAVVTWLGIYPTVAFFLWFVAPLLAHWPFLLRTAVITALIVVAMTWVVAPRVTRWMRPWLMADGKPRGKQT